MRIAGLMKALVCYPKFHTHHNKKAILFKIVIYNTGFANLVHNV